MSENGCHVRYAPITVTRRDVDDKLFARLQRHYDDDTIAEMTMIIAWENSSSRSNRAFRSHRKGSGSHDGLDLTLAL
jgi:hypothetical protein